MEPEPPGSPPAEPRAAALPANVGVTLLILFAPALVSACLPALGQADDRVLVGFLLVAFVGGPCSGFLAARRLARGLAPGGSLVARFFLALLCVVTSIVACFAGCASGASAFR